MKKRASRIYSERFHTVVPLGDGRVRIRFGQPIAQSKSQLWLLAMLGNRRGNEIITKAGKIVGVVVWPDTWVEILRALGAPREHVQEFQKLIDATPTSRRGHYG